MIVEKNMELLRLSNKLNLGCGKDVREGWINLDYDPRVKGVINFDLMQPWKMFGDAEIDEIYAGHIIEHIPRGKPLAHVIREMARVTKPGAIIEMRLPHPYNLEAVWSHHEHCGPIFPMTILQLRGEHSNSIHAEEYFTLVRKKSSIWVEIFPNFLPLGKSKCGIFIHLSHYFKWLKPLWSKPREITYIFKRNEQPILKL